MCVLCALERATFSTNQRMEQCVFLGQRFWNILQWFLSLFNLDSKFIGKPVIIDEYKI